MPFVQPVTERGGVRVLYAPLAMQSRLIFSDGRVMTLPKQGLPLAVIDAGEKSAVVMRGLPKGSA